MRFRKNAPFVFLLPPFVAGILLRLYLPLPAELWKGSLILIIAAFGIFRILPVERLYTWRYISGLLIYGLFVAAGALTLQFQLPQSETLFPESNTDTPETFHAFPESGFLDKPRSFTSRCLLYSRSDAAGTVTLLGRIQLYIQKDSVSAPPPFASQLIFTKRPEPIKNNGNPGAFDYRQYMRLRGIGYQVFLADNEYLVVQQKTVGGWTRLLNSIREYILSILRRYIPGKREQGLAEALLLGYRNDLDRDLSQQYADAGTIHIIAISGLHLGLIYTLLLFLFRPFRYRKKLKAIRILLIMFLLWLFAFLTGASPSVTRSAIMFSCLLAGEGLLRKNSIYNSLAFAAFLSLSLHPLWILDAGFQLSYTAVLGILVFYKPVYTLLYIPSKFIDFFWKLIVVSTVAQAFTWPLVLYHFHRFPVYFLLGNLCAVPLAGLILPLEILLCMLNEITPLARLLGWLLNALIAIMNAGSGWVSSLPFAVWEPLQVSVVQTLLLYAFFIFFVAAFFYRQRIALVFSFIFLLSAFLCRYYHIVQLSGQQRIIVYNIPRRAAVDFIAGSRCLLYSDTSFQESQEAVRLARNYYRTDRQGENRPVSDDVLVRFGHQRVMLLHKGTLLKKIKPGSSIDLLIISGNPSVDPEEWLSRLKIGTVVASPGAGFRTIASWRSACIRRHIQFHPVSEQGAFVMSLN